jgi:hypothetical protein
VQLFKSAEEKHVILIVLINELSTLMMNKSFQKLTFVYQHAVSYIEREKWRRKLFHIQARRHYLFSHYCVLLYLFFGNDAATA